MTATVPVAFTFFENVLLASCYLALGGPMLALSLQRAQEVPPRQSQQDFSFAELYLPEKNSTVLRYYGLGFVGLAALGLASAVLGTLAMGLSLEVLLIQGVSMGGFFAFGAVAFLESETKLAPDSHRIALALGSAVMAVARLGPLMDDNDNSDDLSPEKIHEVGSLVLNLATASTMAYSVHSIHNMVAFIAAWALPVLSGLWCLTVLPFLCCWRDHAQLMTPFLALEASMLYFFIFMVVAFIIPSSSAPRPTNGSFHEYGFDELKGEGGAGEDGSEIDSRDDASNLSNHVL